MDVLAQRGVIYGKQHDSILVSSEQIYRKRDGIAVSIQDRWFALYTKPHKEYLVRELLSAQEVEVYLPEIAVRTKRRDRRDKRPFFPHYMFARLDLQDGMIAKMRWTPGLRCIVSVGGQPVPVPDEVVQEVRRRLAAMAQIEPEELFREGDVVHVTRGPFEGLDAVFDRRLSAQGRVRVFLQWMSRQVTAELDVEDLLPS
jgi:transcriptional antiterminator RfaH